MSYLYKVYFKFKARDFLSHVRQLEDSINNSMAGFGFQEKIFFESQSPMVDLTSNRILTEEEKNIIINSYNKELVDKNMECTELVFVGAKNE